MLITTNPNYISKKNNSIYKIYIIYFIKNNFSLIIEMLIIKITKLNKLNTNIN